MDSSHSILLGSLIGMIRASEDNMDLVDEGTQRLVRDAMAVYGETEISPDVLDYILSAIRKEKHRLSPGCASCAMPCGKTADFDVTSLERESEEVRGLKLVLLAEVQNLSSHGGDSDLIFRALYAIGQDAITKGYLQSLVDEMRA